MIDFDDTHDPQQPAASDDAGTLPLRPANGQPHAEGRNLAAAPAERASALNRLVLGLVLGALVPVVVGLVVLVVLVRDPLPPLTEADYQAAVARWEAAGVCNYDLDVELEGKQPGQIHVEVRDGRAVRMTRNGVQPRAERTWWYWTVPGMLETIGDELDKSRDPAAGFRAPPDAVVRQWARFDPQRGYPARYHRAILGTDLEIAWNVVRFVADP